MHSTIFQRPRCGGVSDKSIESVKNIIECVILVRYYVMRLEKVYTMMLAMK